MHAAAPTCVTSATTTATTTATSTAIHHRNPPRQDALFSPTGCLRLLGEVSDALGAVCIPALLLVLGANLSRGPGVAAGRLPASCVVAAVATRLLLLPAVCGALLVAAWSAGVAGGGGLCCVVGRKQKGTWMIRVFALVKTRNMLTQIVIRHRIEAC